MLAKAPWNCTEAYVRSHLLKDGLGRMSLQGLCDPSGRGEGYAFLRLTNPKDTEKKKTKAEKLVNTDRDLRKLTKDDAIALLVAMGEDAAKMRALKVCKYFNRRKCNVSIRGVI